MSSNLSSLVADEIRVCLTRKRATQEQLAEAIGISQATLSRRLSGASAFDLAEIEAAAEFLDVPLSTLLPAAVAS